MAQGGHKMRKIILSGLAASLMLTACGSMRDSGLNPFNWFGRSRSEPVSAESGPVNPLIPQRGGGIFARRAEPEYFAPPVDTIADLAVERVAGGAIIRAKGIAATQGSWDARLVKDEEASTETVLVYTLMARKTNLRELVGPAHSREVVVAKHLTDSDLAGIRTIRVKGARNVHSTTRR